MLKNAAPTIPRMQELDGNLCAPDVDFVGRGSRAWIPVTLTPDSGTGCGFPLNLTPATPSLSPRTRRRWRNPPYPVREKKNQRRATYLLSPGDVAIRCNWWCSPPTWWSPSPLCAPALVPRRRRVSRRPRTPTNLRGFLSPVFTRSGE